VQELSLEAQQGSIFSKKFFEGRKENFGS